MPQLVIEQPGISIQTVPIGDKDIVLGRSSECDIVLSAGEISRHHAKIVVRDANYVLVDLKSLNGTYLNGQRITEHILKHMDEIWLGSQCRIIFRDDTQYGKTWKEDTINDTKEEIIHHVEHIREQIEEVESTLFQINKEKEEDSQALDTAYTPIVDIKKLGRAYRRLDVLYKATQIMGSAADLDTKLAQVLDLVIEVLSADRGFILLKDESGKSLVTKVARAMENGLEASSPSMGIAGKAAIDGEPVLMIDRLANPEFGNRESVIMRKITSAMCVPLKIENRILGSIYIDSIQKRAFFDDEDLELFFSLSNQIALAIENAQLNQKMIEEEKRRENFRRFLPDVIVEEILKAGSNIQLGGDKKRVTTMFCDIRGSSKLAESVSPQELVALLNEHFTAITEIVFAWHGTLDKYIGDEIMAVFGAPISTGDDAYAAVCAALNILKTNEELNVIRISEGKPAFQLGIGIETGDVIAGFIGSPKRMEYTVVGDRVNIAKRLCDMANPGSIVVGNETWLELKDRVRGVPIGTFKVKNKEQFIVAYEIKELL
ncbi:MAG TPA: adenylate/guanylate cyclase domain-containing protein [Candidatus Hydrogenedens sp.]|nr:adenylate/guanylate cyclase domain-containing protein [Candidatus Hydrogenedens sp.]HOL18620.1 adenylate/guanylate cyclase domain-containing protein [Candidatus Hydrogenedens sp.]HPP57534.1 adenylate/guanylate cyclase domain-containing protein [Candidatus Hydrogenedens sp.]